MRVSPWLATPSFRVTVFCLSKSHLNVTTAKPHRWARMFPKILGPSRAWLSMGCSVDGPHQKWEGSSRVLSRQPRNSGLRQDMPRVVFGSGDRPVLLKPAGWEARRGGVFRPHGVFSATCASRAPLAETNGRPVTNSPRKGTWRSDQALRTVRLFLAPQSGLVADVG